MKRHERRSVRINTLILFDGVYQRRRKEFFFRKRTIWVCDILDNFIHKSKKNFS